MNRTMLVSPLEEALDRNIQCRPGMLLSKRAFAIDRGPSGAPEVLALIMADDPYGDKFWYGHIVVHPRAPGIFIALLCWLDRFVNAENVPLLFRRYHHWTRINPHYQPCTIQFPDDAFCECRSFNEAVAALARMVDRFDWDKRSAYEGSIYSDSPLEMRILDIYGVVSHQDADGVYPPVPTATPLRLVKG